MFYNHPITGTTAISISLDEFWTCSESLNVGAVWSLPDHREGMDPETTAATRQEALKNLADRGLCRLPLNNASSLHPVLSSMLQVCLTSQFLVDIQSFGMQRDIFHFSCGKCVLLSFRYLPVMDLVQIPCNAVLVSYLAPELGLVTTQVGRPPAFSLSVEAGLDFDGLFEQEEIERLSFQIKKDGISSELEGRLMAVLPNPSIHASLVPMKRGISPQRLGEYAVLGGKDDLWWVQFDQAIHDKEIHFEPASAGILRRKLLKILDQVSPENNHKA